MLVFSIFANVGRALGFRGDGPVLPLGSASLRPTEAPGIFRNTFSTIVLVDLKRNGHSLATVLEPRTDSDPKPSEDDKDYPNKVFKGFFSNGVTAKVCVVEGTLDNKVHRARYLSLEVDPAFKGTFGVVLKLTKNAFQSTDINFLGEEYRHLRNNLLYLASKEVPIILDLSDIDPASLTSGPREGLNTLLPDLARKQRSLVPILNASDDVKAALMLPNLTPYITFVKNLQEAAMLLKSS